MENFIIFTVVVIAAALSFFLSLYLVLAKRRWTHARQTESILTCQYDDEKRQCHRRTIKDVHPEDCFPNLEVTLPLLLLDYTTTTLKFEGNFHEKSPSTVAPVSRFSQVSCELTNRSFLPLPLWQFLWLQCH